MDPSGSLFTLPSAEGGERYEGRNREASSAYVAPPPSGLGEEPPRIAPGRPHLGRHFGGPHD